MNTVWNSYGQLLRLPEKTSKKMQIFETPENSV